MYNISLFCLTFVYIDLFPVVLSYAILFKTTFYITFYNSYKILCYISKFFFITEKIDV